ncbi:MAG: SPOR domain-containing protein [Nevskiaceae bacterium]
MSRDYAHRGNGSRQTAGGGMPGWLWLLVGVALGFGGAVAYYITRPAADTRVAADAADAGKGNDKKKITIPPKEPSRFTFYELLPDYEVVIPKEALKEGNKPVPALRDAPAASPGRFLIQVGSFKDRGEAEQQKANLALLGVESRIEKVTIDNSQTWYRVRIGPEKDQRRVESILARLEENDIKALVMMVPD